MEKIPGDDAAEDPKRLENFLRTKKTKTETIPVKDKKRCCGR
ncbi:MAG: hypothetical protein AABY44_00010 [Nitrospirota bacterium]